MAHRRSFRLLITVHQKQTVGGIALLLLHWKRNALIAIAIMPSLAQRTQMNGQKRSIPTIAVWQVTFCPVQSMTQLGQ